MDKEAFCDEVRERRRVLDRASRRLRGIESEARHGKPSRMLVDIFPDEGRVTLEDCAVRVIYGDKESFKEAFNFALQQFRAECIALDVQSPPVLKSTDFSIALDTDGGGYFSLDMEDDLYDLVDQVLTEEVLNNNPVED